VNDLYSDIFPKQGIKRYLNYTNAYQQHFNSPLTSIILTIDVSLQDSFDCFLHLPPLWHCQITPHRHLEISSTKLSDHTTHTMTMMDTHPTSDLTTELLSSTLRLTKHHSVVNSYGGLQDYDLSDKNKQWTCGDDECF